MPSLHPLGTRLGAFGTKTVSTFLIPYNLLPKRKKNTITKLKTKPKTTMALENARECFIEILNLAVRILK